ncbi:CU044_2847 family protein [Nocardiopsis ganjiahuensis]|uniref:CU044_2847 family protein n=1 Tax=Nocardiopsis ganjiahuensis TaxID=239984 RepID=UPI0003488676|nr:CU044_2847 family protein [Nocardiopsis ganjiahuensis]
MGHAVAELVAFTDDDGSQLVVEVADSDTGPHPVGVRVDGATAASKGLGETMETLQNVVGVLLGQLRQMSLSPERPDEVTAEFGVKFTPEVGAVIAKVAGEGHITVQVKWNAMGSAPTGTS